MYLRSGMSAELSTETSHERSSSLPEYPQHERLVVLLAHHTQLAQDQPVEKERGQPRAGGQERASGERDSQPADKVQLHPATVVNASAVAPALGKVGG